MLSASAQAICENIELLNIDNTILQQQQEQQQEQQTFEYRAETHDANVYNDNNNEDEIELVDLLDYETNYNTESSIHNMYDVDDEHMLEYHTDAATEALNLLLPELQQQQQEESETLECENFHVDVDDFNNCLNNIFSMVNHDHDDDDDDDDNKKINKSDSVTTTTVNVHTSTTEIMSLIPLDTIPDINNITNNAIDDSNFVVFDDSSSSTSNNSATTTTTTTKHIIHHNSNKNNMKNHNVVGVDNSSSSNSNQDILNCRNHNNVFA